MQESTVRLAHEPQHPHYDAVIDHVGTPLTPAVEQDPRCQDLGIATGPDYLRQWIASAIPRPEQRLPVIHLYGGPAAGKSAFAWLLRAILAAGYRHIPARFKLFNDELDGTIVAVAEDAHGSAFSELATMPTLTINRRGKEPYETPNRLHVIACSNTPPAMDDSAVVAIEVPPLENRIPYDVLRDRLEAEARAFLNTLYRVELPEGGLPVPKGVAMHVC